MERVYTIQVVFDKGRFFGLPVLEIDSFPVCVGPRLIVKKSFGRVSKQVFRNVASQDFAGCWTAVNRFFQKRVEHVTATSENNILLGNQCCGVAVMLWWGALCTTGVDLHPGSVSTLPNLSWA